ncbi:MAG: DUF423 domain-containing protein [Janthinobacterium lividum]
MGAASRPTWPWGFVVCSGLLGAVGVIVGAAGTHRGGGELTRISSEFLLIHAAVILAGSAMALVLGRTSGLWVAALGLLTVGAILFSGELALAGFLDWRPFPLAAPTGGLCLIAGWMLMAVAALLIGLRRR